MVLCAIFGCGTRTVRDKGVYMARIPSVVTNQGDEIRILSEERRKKWISAISRKDLTDSILEHGRVCGRHFISGKAAKVWDRYDPDWIPTQNLGHNKCDAAEKLQADLEAAGKRDERVRDREMKRVAAENEKRLREEIEAKRQKIDEPGEKVSDISFNLDSAMEVETETGTATQTEEFDYLFHTSTAKPTFDETYFANDNEKDLAYRFGISIATVSRTFSAWMVVLDARLAFLIRWPEREDLWQTMPQCFQVAFGNKTTVIIDCFEVFINRPSNLMARAQTYSNYKNHNTVKILVGITPQGSISFASNAWGGRTSDKFLTDNCGILKKLLPGDLVMADRGFTIQESLIFHGAELATPAFTRGKDQLDPVDVEGTRGIANVRIHVERIIGLLRRKYTILSGILPIDFLQCDPNGSQEAKIPMIDKIITVCAALTNLSNGIVPLD
ncbi:hypothetical protein AWC38_SpisGene19597 [Stylophora pistillata]|uniref:THAP-type domain-containing protein n=1 Tax=Stylophora pistillata TaxID=50429 RepID=A0A2B4RH42_STYPI|nr:hypothetical protein AWC38_SpisGene19597 [Stylophora pistillata]